MRPPEEPPGSEAPRSRSNREAQEKGRRRQATRRRCPPPVATRAEGGSCTRGTSGGSLDHREVRGRLRGCPPCARANASAAACPEGRQEERRLPRHMRGGLDGMHAKVSWSSVLRGRGGADGHEAAPRARLRYANYLQTRREQHLSDLQFAPVKSVAAGGRSKALEPK